LALKRKITLEKGNFLDMYTRDAQNLLLHVSALLGCHSLGAFLPVKVLLPKRSAVRSAVTHLTR